MRLHAAVALGLGSSIGAVLLLNTTAAWGAEIHQLRPELVQSSDQPNYQDEDEWSESPEEQAAEVEQARKSLESRYRDPKDVSLAPKLLVPKDKLPGANRSFDVFQLQHVRGLPTPGSPLGLELTLLQAQTAQLRTVAVDINSARINAQTPAQEFFNVASWITAGLGSAAIALAIPIVARGKSRRAHPN